MLAPRCFAQTLVSCGRRLRLAPAFSHFGTIFASRFYPKWMGTARCKVPNIAAAARKKLRLALLMTDDGNVATRLRTLVEKYRARALIAEQRVLEVPSAPPEAVDPTDLPEWTRNDRWK